MRNENNQIIQNSITVYWRCHGLKNDIKIEPRIKSYKIFTDLFLPPPPFNPAGE